MSSETPAPAPKKSKKLVIIIAAVLLLGGGGAGAGWYVKRGQGDGEHAEAPKKVVAKKPIFTPLDPFTVNLKDERGERFAQVGVTLQLDDPEIENQLKDRMPAVRNQILLLITSKSIDELLTADGKAVLARQIRVKAAQAIGVEVEDEAATVAKAEKAKKADDEEEDEDKPKKKKKKKAKDEVENPVKEVLFSQFIVQ